MRIRCFSINWDTNDEFCLGGQEAILPTEVILDIPGDWDEKRIEDGAANLLSDKEGRLVFGFCWESISNIEALKRLEKSANNNRGVSCVRDIIYYWAQCMEVSDRGRRDFKRAGFSFKKATSLYDAGKRAFKQANETFEEGKRRFNTDRDKLSQYPEIRDLLDEMFNTTEEGK